MPGMTLEQIRAANPQLGDWWAVKWEIAPTRSFQFVGIDDTQIYIWNHTPVRIRADQVLSLHGPGDAGKKAAEYAAKCFGAVGKWFASEFAATRIVKYEVEGDAFHCAIDDDSEPTWRVCTKKIFAKHNIFYPTREEAQAKLGKDPHVKECEAAVGKWTQVCGFIAQLVQYIPGTDIFVLHGDLSAWQERSAVILTDSRIKYPTREEAEKALSTVQATRLSADVITEMVRVNTVNSEPPITQETWATREPSEQAAPKGESIAYYTDGIKEHPSCHNLWTRGFNRGYAYFEEVELPAKIEEANESGIREGEKRGAKAERKRIGDLADAASVELDRRIEEE